MQKQSSVFKQEDYVIRLGNRPLIVNLTRMEATIMVWIGSPFNKSFSNLAVTVSPNPDTSSTTVLLSKIDNNDLSERLSRTLSRKFNQMVYVSCGLQLSEEERYGLLSNVIDLVSKFLQM